MPYIIVLKAGKSLLLIDYLLTFEAGLTARKHTLNKCLTEVKQKKVGCTAVFINEMLTATIIVARVQPGTSKGITDLLLPQPSSGLKKLQRSL